MVFRSSIPPKDFPKVSLFELLFNHHLPYDESKKKFFIDASDETKFLTFRDVKNNVLQVAAGLTNVFGLQRKDVVAICSPNEMLFPIVLHGTVTAGGITAAVDHTLVVEDIATDLDLVQPKVIVTHKDVLDKVLEAVKISKTSIDESHILIFGDRCVRGIRTVQEVLLDHGKLGVPVKYQPDELAKTVAYLFFTSGSTGARKAVMITHASMSATIHLLEVTPVSTDDIILMYGGFQHTAGLWMAMHNSIYYGVEVVLLKPFTLETFCQTIQRLKVTHAVIHPWVVSSLVRDPIVDQYDISSLKRAFCANSATEKSVVNSLYKNKNVALYDIYALTELLGVFEITCEISLEGGVGKLARGVTAKLVDDDGNEVKEGEEGELCIKSPTAMLGYFKNQKDTDEAFDSEGYFHSGDIFTVDKNEIFYFVDRKKSMIKYYLHHVHPQTIVDILLSHPKVTDCGVVGVFSNDLVTELPRAYVKVVDAEEDTAQLAQELKSFVESRVDDSTKLRGGLYIVKNLPMTASGKVNRLKLTQIEQNSIVAIV